MGALCDMNLISFSCIIHGINSSCLTPLHEFMLIIVMIMKCVAESLFDRGDDFICNLELKLVKHQTD
jgi:hypothetical protein